MKFLSFGRLDLPPPARSAHSTRPPSAQAGSARPENSGSFGAPRPDAETMCLTRRRDSYVPPDRATPTTPVSRRDCFARREIRAVLSCVSGYGWQSRRVPPAAPRAGLRNRAASPFSRWADGYSREVRRRWTAGAWGGIWAKHGTDERIELPSLRLWCLRYRWELRAETRRCRRECQLH